MAQAHSTSIPRKFLITFTALLLGILVFSCISCSNSQNSNAGSQTTFTDDTSGSSETSGNAGVNANTNDNAEPNSTSEEAESQTTVPQSAEPTTPEVAPVPNTPASEDQVQQIINSLTPEQKVAQLFIVRPESITGVDTQVQAGETTRSAIATYPVGGICYFGKNLVDTAQTTQMLTNTQSYSHEAVGLPMFIAVDEEGGSVSRIGGAEGFGIPNVGDMAAIGATGDTQKAYDTAVTVGTYLKNLGFNLDFAPDTDVADNPNSDTMSLRSFGADANSVASMVKAQVEGYLSTGILCCAKHFPGIGAAEGDSHDDSIYSYKTIEEMQANELIPFQAAISAGVPFIMIGHLTAQQATGSDLPASLNPAIITDLLRNQLGFQGVIITDSLEMGAVSEIYSTQEVGVKVLEAGADMILMPQDFKATYQGIIDAVHNRTLSEDRINDSLRRIIGAKLLLTH